ncbi:MAG: ABC-F family ATP-binding cassette domain-containing protein [Deltaproteobacteria bacterium]|nr:ABC-F family ATP-binding cassette domain-containing protein [Deltaproteobacteria bacterium]
MLSIQNLHKTYGHQVLFKGVTLQMERGERLGLAGRNGHGKSTLFRIILKELEADSGQVIVPRGYRIGHLAQHLHFTKPTVREEACLGLPPGEEHAEYKAEKILFGLGFSEEDLICEPSTFSGGFQIRINLAKLLVSDPDLLLLDEPTNYLDIISIRWITRFLKQWKKELILITHDRDFMDSITTHTALIHRHKIRKQPGPTGPLMTQVALEEETHERTRVNDEKQRKHIEAFVARFKAKAATATRAQSRIKMLEKMPEKDKLAAIASLDFAFNAAPFVAKHLLRAESVSFGYTEDSPLLTGFSLQVTSQDRIAFIGRNGRGKSTLLNLLAGELNPQSGTIKKHPETAIGFFGQTNIDRLHPQMTVEKEISESNPELGFTAVRTLCGTMMFTGDMALKKISVLSGGERSRVLLGKILAAPANILLLDEPTNHLDMDSIDALVESLKDFEGAVVIVTHNEEILRRLATRLVVFQQHSTEIFNGNYDEFLEKIGWEEEGDAGASKKRTAAPPSLKPVTEKDERRQKAETIAERSKILTPLKKEMESLEKEIVLLEEEQKGINEKILEASQKKEIETFVALSKSLKELQKNIDKKFSRLEKVTLDYQQASKEA